MNKSLLFLQHSPCINQFGLIQIVLLASQPGKEEGTLCYSANLFIYYIPCNLTYFFVNMYITHKQDKL